MDLIDILPQLEALARKINFQPLDDLIEQIKRFCEHMLKQVTPGEPIREGGQALNAYANRLSDLTTQLNAGLENLQQTYSGPASAQYMTTASTAISRARRLQGHINDAATYHSTLANHCIEAVFQQGMLIVQGGIMAVDLGSTIATLGADAPVSVPVAAADAVVADGSAVAMDAAVDGAEATMSVIGESAADLGEVAGDLGEEGSTALEEGGSVGETSAAEGDPPTTEGGSGSGEEPPSEGGGNEGGDGSEGSDNQSSSDDPDGSKQQELDDIQKRWNVGGKRTVSRTTYNINGESDTLYSASGQASRAGMVDTPENPTFEADPEEGDPNPRTADAEYKILNEIASRFADNPEAAQGEIDMSVSRPPCPSCRAVIDAFREMFPNIQFPDPWFPK